MQYPTNNGRAYPVNSSVRGRQPRFTVAGKTEIGEIFCVCAQKDDMVTNNVERKQHGMLLIVLSGSTQNVLSCSLLALSRKLDCNSLWCPPKCNSLSDKNEHVVYSVYCIYNSGREPFNLFREPLKLHTYNCISVRAI